MYIGCILFCDARKSCKMIDMGCFSPEEMPQALDKGSQPYSCPFWGCEMAGMELLPIISACPWVGDISSPCPLPNSKVPGVGIALSSYFAVPKGTAVWLATIVRCLWHHSLSDIANACLMVIKLRIRKNDYLSNNIRILTPKNRGYWSRKGHSVEKTPFFAVFGKALTDRWLHGY